MYTEIYQMVFTYSSNRSAIFSAINTRDLTKNLVRVKSSNIWSFGINVRQAGDNKGDVICQFKDKNGGAGDIYLYEDVPVQVYRKWISAPSKGHYFWQYIRDNYMYRKLTGDKRTHLKNGR